MTILTFSMYDPTTGYFVDKHISGSLEVVTDMDRLDPVNSMILGEYDHLSQRVDLDTGLVVDYVPPSPGMRYVWDAETKRWVYVPGEVEALYHAQQAALERINLEGAAQLAAMRAGYPTDEVTSWAKQEGEARAWTADNGATTPLLTSIAAARGVPFDFLVAKVIEKADLFAAFSGQVIGMRQHREDRIMAATKAAEVQTIMAELFPPA